MHKRDSMEELRLIDILAQFFVADPKSVKWDDSGSCDTITFTTSGKNKQKFFLKLIIIENVYCRFMLNT